MSQREDAQNMDSGGRLIQVYEILVDMDRSGLRTMGFEPTEKKAKARVKELGGYYSYRTVMAVTSGVNSFYVVRNTDLYDFGNIR